MGESDRRDYQKITIRKDLEKGFAYREIEMEEQ